MVHKRDNSDICAVRKVWREGMPYKEKQEIGSNQELTKVVWIYKEGSTAQSVKTLDLTVKYVQLEAYI